MRSLQVKSNVTILQSHRACRAVVEGRFLGLLMDGKGEVITVYEYDGEPFACLNKELGNSMKTLLEHLEPGTLFSGILGCEFPERDESLEATTFVRENHVRFDLLLP